MQEEFIGGKVITKSQIYFYCNIYDSKDLALILQIL